MSEMTWVSVKLRLPARMVMRETDGTVTSRHLVDPHGFLRAAADGIDDIIQDGDWDWAADGIAEGAERFGTLTMEGVANYGITGDLERWEAVLEALGVPHRFQDGGGQEWNPFMDVYDGSSEPGRRWLVDCDGRIVTTADAVANMVRAGELDEWLERSLRAADWRRSSPPAWEDGRIVGMFARLLEEFKDPSRRQGFDEIGELLDAQTSGKHARTEITDEIDPDHEFDAEDAEVPA